jgi:RNA polymerase sigma-70 factor (ECF subfamily)
MTTSPDFADALVAQLPGLRRYAVALAGNAALADDLVQDCIERALGQERQLREIERLGAWLRRILYHLYIDEIRRNKRRGREHDITELADQLELSAPAPDNSAMREFIHAVNRLSVEHRQILLLISVEELSYREIADELDIPLGTVMSRLARARERLRELMQNDSAEIISLPDRKRRP